MFASQTTGSVTCWDLRSGTLESEDGVSVLTEDKNGTHRLIGNSNCHPLPGAAAGGNDYCACESEGPKIELLSVTWGAEGAAVPVG